MSLDEMIDLFNYLLLNYFVYCFIVLILILVLIYYIFVK